jgi:hypothetical protein
LLSISKALVVAGGLVSIGYGLYNICKEELRELNKID